MVTDEVKQYVIDQHIAQQQAFRENTQWMREEIKELKQILIAICLSQPNEEIFISDVAMSKININSNLTKFELITMEDKENRGYIIKVKEQ